MDTDAPGPSEDHRRRRVLQSEFERAAPSFSERTKNRFDALDVVAFARAASGGRMLEVGSGTGNFLRQFDHVAGQQVGVDLTFGMLAEGRRRHPAIRPVQADGKRLPFASRSFDLATTAQTLHHVGDPLPLLRELRRVVTDEGHVLIVDQVSSERFEEIAVRHELEVLRDPSHAATRPPSSFGIMARAVGLDVVDQQISTGESRLSQWMWPGEYPAERIEAVRHFIEEQGDKTGMEWHKEGDDWVFTRRRIMLLARR